MRPRQNRAAGPTLRPASRRGATRIRRADPASSSLAKKSDAKPAKKAEKPDKHEKAVKAEAPRAKKVEPAAKAKTPVEKVPRRVEMTVAITAFEGILAIVGKQDWKGALAKLKAFSAEYPNEIELLDRVGAYTKVCEQNLRAAPPAPKTAEDHYSAGVLRLNQGAFEEAARHFEKATALDAKLDKARYAMASALALKNDRPGALEHLRQAIELNPENRIFAANDSDLESLRDDPEFSELVGRAARVRAAAKSESHRPGDDESE